MPTNDPIRAAWLSISNRTPTEPAPLQRPYPLFLPGLRAKPWWSEEDVPQLAIIKRAFPELRAEATALLQSGQLSAFDARTAVEEQRTGDQQLVEGRTGGWTIHRLWYYGVRVGDYANCPVTVNALAQVRGLTGTVGYAVMLPGTHLTAHCGLTNAKIRCHLGIDVPDGCSLRVGDETRSWREGQWLVFDDSFEHEVWHSGNRPRVVLILDFYHPDLTPAEVAWLERLIDVFRRKKGFEEL